MSTDICIISYFSTDSIIDVFQEEQDLAARQSSFINQAYRTLKDPLKRSIYLLELAGHHLEEGTVSLFEMLHYTVQH